jgi:N-acetylglucosamine kinase-like BadF-type ATPase
MDYVLGFDGGGTKTDCVLMDETGRLLAWGRSGASNPTRTGIDRAIGNIQAAATDAILNAAAESKETGTTVATKISRIVAGLAGTGQPEISDKMRVLLGKAFPGASIRVCTDLDIALAAAGEGPVVVLVAGTGSAAIGRNARGEIWRAGGQGRLYGDEGSSYDIGRKAVARAREERERQGTDSNLGKKILEQLGYANWAELQERSSAEPDEVFPHVFPIVAAAGEAGDSNAREILLHAARDLATLVAAVADHLGTPGEDLRIAKTGGALGRSVFFDAQVDAALKKALPHAQIGGLRMSPAEAAARAARS